MNGTNKLKIYWIEVLFMVVAALVTAIVVGKYLSVFLTGNDLSINLENLIATQLNNTTNLNSDVDNIKTYNLMHDDNGEWKITDENGISARFAAINVDGVVSIKDNISNKSSHEIVINGVNSYFGNDGLVKTEIPYTTHLSVFYAQVQEDLFPIIGYHNVYNSISEIIDPYLDISNTDFERQLKTFNTALNCRWITFSEIMSNYITIERKIPKNTCVMTFDDGRVNNYDVVFPILIRNNVRATFNVIAGRLGQKNYMTNLNLRKLYSVGNDVGSHSLTGGSLIHTEWYKDSAFTSEVLWSQVSDSKHLLESYGYNVTTFAYPLGDNNDQIVSVIRKAGYTAARGTKKAHSWRTPRALATSLDADFIWHMNYYEPELKFDEEIKKDLAYTGWWQFEEGMIVLHDSDTVKLLSSNTPTNESYGLVSMQGISDSISNSFLLEQPGNYKINIVGAIPNVENMKFLLDGNTTILLQDDSLDCTAVKDTNYCTYYVMANLEPGKHRLTSVNVRGKNILDKFSIYKEVEATDTYKLKVSEM